MKKNKYTTEIFIQKAINVHGSKYDYSLVEYVKYNQKVKIICKKHHSVFEQSIDKHVFRKQGCPECSQKKKHTNESFIEKAKIIHEKEDYDYSLVEYVNAKTNVKIICQSHGIFEQNPSSHLSGKGCFQCKNDKISNSLRSNTEDFIKKAKKIHKNKYGYEFVNYKSAHSKINIKCNIHGIFSQTPNSHLNKKGCPLCGTEKSVLLKLDNIKDFIKKSKKTHKNRYIYDNVVYERSNKNVEIICKKHGSFFQTPNNHIGGSGCKKCADEKLSEERRLSLRDFKKQCNKIWNNKFDYGESIYINNSYPVQIRCKEHDFVFYQNPTSHLSMNNGCLFCKKISIGEHLIGEFLIKYNISYTPQKIFKDCINKIVLPFDFYLNDLNVLIEFNGEQHYKYVPFFHKNENGFLLQQKKDKIKRKYAHDNNIKIIDISYKDRKEIELILKKELNL